MTSDVFTGMLALECAIIERNLSSYASLIDHASPSQEFQNHSYVYGTR
jgi:hypothetical protein